MDRHLAFAARLAAIGFALATASLSAGTATNRFGFAGPEIFPIDFEIGHIRSADLNEDALQDLVVVNNARSKINLLYNQTGQTNPEPTAANLKRELNELPPDARFRIDSIASEKRITSIVVADLNSDNRPDVAYYGEPKELIVQYNEGTNRWSTPKRWPISDGLLNPNALTHGDINGDKKTDLLFLAEGHVYWFSQTEDHLLAEPEKIPYSGSVLAVQVLDIQGDGREDLLFVNWDSPNPFRFRLQNAHGELGPEIHFPLAPIRSYWADDLDNDRKTEVITIAQKSGRAQVAHFTRGQAEKLAGDWVQGQFQLLPLVKTTKARRGMIWADIDKDQLPDFLVAEPDSGQLTAYRQSDDGSLAPPKTFATLTGVSELAVADWNQDGTPEIFLLSSEERQVGVTQFDEKGRVPFPRILPVEGRPLAMAVGPLAKDRKPSLALILDQDGKRELRLLQADGQSRSQKLSEEFKSNPSSLSIHDVDQDGLLDLLVLIPYEKIKVLLQVEEKDFLERDIAPPGGAVDQPWMSSADVDGDGPPELLLAQKNFVRAVVLQTGPRDSEGKLHSSWTFDVKEQINGVASNSRIVAATPLRNKTNSISPLFLLDAERKSLTFCERDSAGVWQIVRNILLPVSDFRALQPTGFGGPNLNAIAFLGANAVGWMALEGQTWNFTELDGYETSIKNGYLNDVISGDLNQDGRKELVFLETGKSHLDIVLYEPPHQLVPSNRWQVFEERTFRSRRNESPEPREAIILDLTNDGKNDLAIIVHDRVLLYPQE